MNDFINNPILPFLDLECQDNLAAEKGVIADERDLYASLPFMNKVDATLLFMTMAVTLTSENEMPIVAPYTGPLPKDIRGIHRVNGACPSYVSPHFFFNDKMILKYFSDPFETEKILKQFDTSIATDFSMTREMSKIQKMFSSFLNKLWAAWLQSRGHLVIPNVSFPDEWWENYWLEGWPKYSIIAVSSVSVIRHGNPEEWLKGMERIRKELEPLHIIRYGSKIQGENEENCTYILNDNKRAANGW